jgi:hypothetical protein
MCNKKCQEPTYVLEIEKWWRMHQVSEPVMADGNDVRIVRKMSGNPNVGVYAIEVEDAQGRRWILPPEDVEEREFRSEERYGMMHKQCGGNVRELFKRF